MVRNAIVIGVELISRYMDWSNRNVAVLFGDGAAAVVLQASDNEEGVIGSVLGCDAEARQTLARARLRLQATPTATSPSATRCGTSTGR